MMNEHADHVQCGQVAISQEDPPFPLFAAALVRLVVRDVIAVGNVLPPYFQVIADACTLNDAFRVLQAHEHDRSAEIDITHGAKVGCTTL